MKNSNRITVNARLNFLMFVLTLLIGMICIAKTAFGQEPMKPLCLYEITDSTFVFTITDIKDVDTIFFYDSHHIYDTMFVVDHDGYAEYQYRYADGDQEEKIDWMFGVAKLRGSDEDYLFTVQRTDTGFGLWEGNEIEIDINGNLVFKETKK